MATTFNSTGSKPKPKAKKPAATNLAKKLANPGERAKLADKYLTKEQLAQRVLNKRLNAEAAPGLTNREVAQQANADTALKYGAAEKKLADRLQENSDFTVRDQGFYKAYVDAINAAKQQALTQSQQAVGAVTNVGTQLDQASAQNWGQQAQQMQADAAARGANVDPRLALIAQKASEVRSGLTGSYGAMLAAQGNNEQSAWANRALVGTQRGLEQLQNRGTQRTAIEKDQTDLAAEKGLYNTQQRRQIIAGYQDNRLKQASADSLIGDRKADNKRADTSAKRSASQWASTPNKYGVNNGAWQAWSKSAAGKTKQAAAIKKYEADKKKSQSSQKPRTGPGSLTASAEDKKVTQINKIAAIMRAGRIDTKDSTGKVVSTAKGIDAIKKELAARFIDPRIIAVAESMYRNKGALGPYGTKMAHKLGIHVAGNFDQVNK